MDLNHFEEIDLSEHDNRLNMGTKENMKLRIILRLLA